jgi:orotidine 5'-phosphate decarboxylase subfamily 1
MTTLLDILRTENILDAAMIESVATFIAQNKIDSIPQKVTPPKGLTYEERAKQCTQPIAQRLLTIIHEKKTNLCVSVDLTKKGEVLALAEAVGPSICMLKTHADIIEDFDVKFTQDLKEIAKKLNFLIFEDRKFADIGNTVALQLTGGVHHIGDWADVITVHAVAGPGTLSALKSASTTNTPAVLLLAEMSSKGTLATGAYTQAVLGMAKENKDLVIGFISTQKLAGVEDSFLFCTPGVQFAAEGDAHGQQYNSPESVIGGSKNSDVIIVGRGVYQASNPREEAEKYRAAGWTAYAKRI